MSFDQDAFVAEVNQTLDQQQEEAEAAIKETGDGIQTEGTAKDAPKEEGEPGQAGGVDGGNGGDSVGVKASDGDTGKGMETEAEGGGTSGDKGETGEGGGKGDGGGSGGEQVKAGKGEGEKGAESSVFASVNNTLIARAVRAGLDIADIRSFSDPATLERVVGIVEASANNAEANGKADASLDPEDWRVKLPELNPEIFAPEVIETIKALVGEVNGQREEIRDFRQEHEAIASVAAEANARDVEQWFDGQVSALGEDFSESLGSGGYGALPSGSSQLAKRDAIANQMAVVLAGHQANGQVPPPREEVFDAAARLILRDEYQQVHEKKLSAKLEGRANQHIQRAGRSKVETKQSPEDETAALINEKYF